MLIGLRCSTAWPTIELSSTGNRTHKGLGGDVGAYLTGKALETAVSKINSARDRSVRADKAAKDGDLAAMHQAYGHVFGDDYPA